MGCGIRHPCLLEVAGQPVLFCQMHQPIKAHRAAFHKCKNACVVLRSSSAQRDECKVVGADNPQGDALNLDNLGFSHRLCSERAESRYELYRPIANPDSLPFGTVAFGSAVVVDWLENIETRSFRQPYKDIGVHSRYGLGVTHLGNRTKHGIVGNDTSGDHIQKQPRDPLHSSIVAAIAVQINHGEISHSGAY